MLLGGRFSVRTTVNDRALVSAMGGKRTIRQVSVGLLFLGNGATVSVQQLLS